jgi:hypothetical protein
MRKFFFIVLIFYVGIGSGNAQLFRKSVSGNVEKGLVGKSSNRKNEAKVREPGSVQKAKKKEEVKKKKQDHEYDKYVKSSRKRAIAIQTPEVQARMKNDRKDSAAKDRAKKKIVKANSKKAGRKYK